MIAKLIAHAPTRNEALLRLREAIEETVIEGVTTNLPFLRWLVAHPLVRAGETTTAFLTEHPPLSAPPLRAPEGPWSTAFRLNLPSPPPAPAPDVDEAAAEHGSAAAGLGSIAAPMPGTVIRVLVAAGDRVHSRQPLLVLEAMKMETPVSSPYDAVVKALHVKEGAAVAAGALLIELQESS
jgi:acetyl/propionyl-CoA carboxylase alpha subunit